MRRLLTELKNHHSVDTSITHRDEDGLGLDGGDPASKPIAGERFGTDVNALDNGYDATMGKKSRR